MINVIVEKAKTTYKVLDKNSICSLVEMKPITGTQTSVEKTIVFSRQSNLWRPKI